MKAIVMAGGEGTRLRPLTGGKPKPMVELLGKPVLWYTVELLKRNEITDLCFTLRYLPKVIEDWFGDGSELGVHIEHRVESEPLGTAGSVRACGDFYEGEDVLVISGDGLCNFDLKSCIRFHREKNADATIVLFEHPEPTEYGLVITDGEGRVTAFSEKPSWERVTTNCVNTGIYILSPAAYQAIPEGQPYDFGKDLFPKLLREGYRVYGVPAQSYWCDIGSPAAYRQCCEDILKGKVGLDLQAPEILPGVWSKVSLRDVELKPPVYVGDRCEIAPGASLGPNVVLSEGTRVGRGSVLRDSVLNGASVGMETVVEGAIIGRLAQVGDRAEIGRDCVIGDGARIGAGGILAPGVKIWNGRETPEGRRVTRSLMGAGPDRPVAFREDGSLRGSLGTGITPETAIGLGGVLGASGRTGVAHTGGEGARLIGDALVCGITAAGGECLEMDCDHEAQLAAAFRVFSLDRAAFVRQERGEVTVTVFEGSGEKPSPALRRKLEAALSGDYPRGEASVGERSWITGAKRAYMSGIVEKVGKLSPAHRGVVLSVTGTGAQNRNLKNILSALGHEVRPPEPGIPSFAVTPGGFDLTMVDERGRACDAHHAAVLACDALMRLGAEEITVSRHTPRVVERLASKYGCKLRWEESGGTRDGVLAASLIAAAMGESGKELATLYDGVPPFALAKRRVDVACSRAKAMRLMAAAAGEMAEELSAGLILKTDRGRARIAPTFDGKALEILSEGDTAEAARELCVDFERLARDITK